VLVKSTQDVQISTKSRYLANINGISLQRGGANRANSSENCLDQDLHPEHLRNITDCSLHNSVGLFVCKISQKSTHSDLRSTLTLTNELNDYLQRFVRRSKQPYVSARRVQISVCRLEARQSV